jgi:hypothetical protein
MTRFTRAEIAKSNLSRREITLGAANQDGSAHVDRELDRKYARLVEEGGLGFFFARSVGAQSICWRRSKRGATSLGAFLLAFRLRQWPRTSDTTA